MELLGMRVAIFIDGKNFFAGWRDATGAAPIDFRKLTPWIVRAAGGDHLMGAYYFTGVDDTIPRTPAQERLDNFLDMLQQQPGFFVQRFAQKTRTQTCASCGQSHSFSQEKQVDTTIVAEMLRLAAVNGFDIAVLISGDADLVPAVEGVRALGKKVFVAAWGQSGLSARIRKAAFDHIDLTAGLGEFGGRPYQGFVATGAPTFAHVASSPANGGYGATASSVAPLSNDPVDFQLAMVEEIKRAQAAMPGGYVGIHFFVNRWRSERLPEIPELRRRTLDRIVADRKVEIYLADDGIQAVRPLAAAAAGVGASVPVPNPPIGAAAPLSNDPAVWDEACVAEIRRAQNSMPGGYIGAHFFVTRWKSSTLPEIPDFRRRTLDRLVEQQKAEVYLTEDGIQAVRLKSGIAEAHD